MQVDYPTPPDPAQTSALQTASNKETAIANANLNRIDQYTPQGNITYTVTGQNEDGTPKYRQDTQLSPWEQQISDANQQSRYAMGIIGRDQINRVGGVLGTPVDFNLAPQDMSRFVAPTQGANLNREAENRLVDIARTRLDPQWAENAEAKKTELLNSGITQGSDAYTRAMRNFDQSKNDAYNSMYAQAQGQMFGQAQQQRAQDFGEGMNAYNTNATTDMNRRNQQIREDLALRNQPINEISALMSGSQVSNPAASAVPGVGMANTDVAGIYNNNFQQQMGVANARNSSQNAMMGGLFGLGSAAMMYSDRRLKTDIKRIGKADNGLPIYSYRYKWGGPVQIGFMADEVEKVAPDAVATVNGFKAVDYGRAA